MRYLIWIPKSDKKTGAALLESVGLGDHARGHDCVSVAGPGTGIGALFGWLDHEQTRLAYRPEEQIWIPSLQEGDREPGAYWVGIWKDSPPTETDLRRPEGRKGVWVTMADGTNWQIPSPDTLERFPEIKDGKLTWVVDEQFSWFCTEIEKLKATRVTWFGDGNGVISFNENDDFPFIVNSLRINYRIVPEVVVHLRLISRSLLQSMTRLVLGYGLTKD